MPEQVSGQRATAAAGAQGKAVPPPPAEAPQQRSGAAGGDRDASTASGHPKPVKLVRLPDPNAADAVRLMSAEPAGPPSRAQEQQRRLQGEDGGVRLLQPGSAAAGLDRDDDVAVKLVKLPTAQAAVRIQVWVCIRPRFPSPPPAGRSGGEEAYKSGARGTRKRLQSCGAPRS